jgi:hypothetical protein
MRCLTDICKDGKSGLTPQSGLTSIAQSVQPVSGASLTGSPSHMAPNQHNASTSTQPNSSNNFYKVLAEYENDLANILKENLGVDVRGKTHTYQKTVSYLL